MGHNLSFKFFQLGLLRVSLFTQKSKIKNQHFGFSLFKNGQCQCQQKSESRQLERSAHPSPMPCISPARIDAFFLKFAEGEDRSWHHPSKKVSRKC